MVRRASDGRAANGERPMVIAMLDSGDAMVEAMVEVMAVLESGGPSASVSVSLI